MTDPSKKSSPKMLPNTSECISSAGLQDGILRSTSLNGQDLFGQVLAPANPSPAPGREGAMRTSGTSGRKCSGSSASADLTACLGSRLRRRLDTVGSMEYSQTWKVAITPAGRRYLAHTASGRRISGRGCGGLPTPQASDDRNRGSLGRNPSIARRIRIGKQIMFSMLFDGKPCPSCAAGMMGYPKEWVESLCAATAMPSSPKSRRSS